MKAIPAALIVLLSYAAAASSGTFKMYSAPNAVVTPVCDVYTTLTIKRTSANTAVATVSEELGDSSLCEIVVPAKKRSYKLRARKDGCGVLNYRNSSGSVRITDHSESICDNEPLAVVIMNERDTIKYSKDQ